MGGSVIRFGKAEVPLGQRQAPREVNLDDPIYIGPGFEQDADLHRVDVDGLSRLLLSTVNLQDVQAEPGYTIDELHDDDLCTLTDLLPDDVLVPVQLNELPPPLHWPVTCEVERFHPGLLSRQGPRRWESPELPFAAHHLGRLPGL